MTRPVTVPCSDSTPDTKHPCQPVDLTLHTVIGEKTCVTYLLPAKMGFLNSTSYCSDTIIISVGWIVLSLHDRVLSIHVFIAFHREHCDFWVCRTQMHLRRLVLQPEARTLLNSMGSMSPLDEFLLSLLVPMPMFPWI